MSELEHMGRVCLRPPREINDRLRVIEKRLTRGAILSIIRSNGGEAV